MNPGVKNVAAVGLVGLLAWLLYAQVSGASLLSGAGVPLPPEAPGLGRLEGLEAVASFTPRKLLGGTPRYDLGGRNLFQYGRIKPPPPTPEELERRRKAEEERLKALEEAARRRREEEEARRKRQAEAKDALVDMNRQMKKSKSAPVRSERKKPPPAPH